MDFVEFRTLGLNVQTAGFLGTLLFTLVSFQSRRLQYHTIMHQRSGESVATSANIFSTFFYGVVLAYGIATQRLALISNGGVMLGGCLAVIFGLWRYKRFTRVDWATVTAGSAILGAMLVADSAPTKSFVFGLTMAGGILWGLLVPYELWRTKKQGAFRIEGALTGAVSTSFWVVYAFATHDPILRVTCPIQLVCISLTIMLWLRYGGDLKKVFRRQSQES